MAQKNFKVYTDIPPETLLLLLKMETKLTENDILIDMGAEIAFVDYHTFVGKIWDDGFRIATTGYDKDSGMMINTGQVVISGHISKANEKTIIDLIVEYSKFDMMATGMCLFMIVFMLLLLRYTEFSWGIVVAAIFLIITGIIFIKSFNWGLKFSMKKLLTALHCEYADIEEVKSGTGNI